MKQVKEWDTCVDPICECVLNTHTQTYTETFIHRHSCSHAIPVCTHMLWKEITNTNLLTATSEKEAEGGIMGMEHLFC